MAKLTKSGARKPIVDTAEMGMSGTSPVDQSGGRVELVMRDCDIEDGKPSHIYRWSLTHQETIRVAVFAAHMATDTTNFDNGFYRADDRKPWQQLRDLADKLEAEDRARIEALSKE